MTNPVPQTDAVFLKHFAQLITFLVVVCILLILLGAYIYSRHPSPENPAQATLVDQRLAPVPIRAAPSSPPPVPPVPDWPVSASRQSPRACT